MRKLPVIVFFILFGIKQSYSSDAMKIHTNLDDLNLMLVSTIDGYITAVEAKTGIEKWKFKEGPILESPIEIQQGFTYITNPKNGQLYFLKESNLLKLPFTIPELVRVSPCRSIDGILYAGNKKDRWISINPETGERTEAFSSSSYCPISHANNVFVGKTEYHISMLDTSSKDRQWNATFIDYTSHLLPPDLNYPFLHYTTSSDGWMVTVDAITGQILWKRDFGSVIISMYLMKKDGMHKLPNTVVGRETFATLMDESTKYWKETLLHNSNEPSKSYQSALYVGQFSDVGLYALSAVVDAKTPVVPAYSIPPLLGGLSPIESDKNIKNLNHLSIEKYPIARTYKNVDSEFLLLGYHEPPPLRPNDLISLSGTTPAAMALLLHLQNYPQLESDDYHDANYQICYGDNCHRSSKRRPPNILISSNNQGFIDEEKDEDDWTLDKIIIYVWKKYPSYLIGIILLIFTLFVTVIWLCGRHSALLSVTNINHLYQNDISQRSQNSAHDSRLNNFFDASPNHNGDISSDIKIVGKLQYNRTKKIGHGSAGTSVYEGMFDNRKVAVKRVMRENFDSVERETRLLRDSDNHYNVIRYFCMEYDNDFGYIALELCEASLDDYVKNKEVREKYSHLSKLDVLKQATKGIRHLHSLQIVHRDVKPRNILLLTQNHIPRVVISDFGLCKAIQFGHNSISKTGIVGTEGWIAPEMISQNSQTCAVDIFSLGCVFFYVLTDGKHPFGDDVIRRQELISKNEYDLKKIMEADNEKVVSVVALELIEDMINKDPARRLQANSVFNHPLFWSKERQLQFFMTVSDRIEKELDDSVPVIKLEYGRLAVISWNWFSQLSEPIQQDLGKFRKYKSSSIRDLLRAMRNKHHHYQELDVELKKSFGDIPDGYVTYFTKRFPKLLMHTYTAMTYCAKESVFVTYYPDDLRNFYLDKSLRQSVFISPSRRRVNPLNGNVVHSSSSTTLMKNTQPNDIIQAGLPAADSTSEIYQAHHYQSSWINSEEFNSWRSPPPASEVKIDIRRQNIIEPKPGFSINTTNLVPENNKDEDFANYKKEKEILKIETNNDNISTNNGNSEIENQKAVTETINDLNQAQSSTNRQKSLKIKAKKRKRKKPSKAPLSILAEICADEELIDENDESGEECADIEVEKKL